MTALGDRLGPARIVPVVVTDSVAQAGGIAAALVAGGLPVAEVTFRTPAAADAIAAMTDRGDILVGAGTVLNAAQVDRAVAAGARFIVAPGVSRAVVERAREHGVPVIPGAVTATEIMAALDLGLDTVKFFPAEASGGIAALTALAAPFGGVSFLPTGGIGQANLTSYLTHPQVIAAGGSWMLPGDAVAAGAWGEVTRLTAAAVALAGGGPAAGSAGR